MRSVLARTENQIHLLSGWVIAADGLSSFRRKPDLAAHEHEAVGTAKRAQVHRRQCFLLHQIDHSERMVCPTAVVGNIRELSIGGCDYFVGIRADGHPSDNLQTRRIDDRERVVTLGEY